MSAAKKPVEKRPKASNKEEDWVEVLNRKDLRKKKKKEKKLSRTPEKSSHARPEAVLIKPAEGMSYASILHEPRSESTLKDWAPQYRESGRRAPRTW